jgi:hypothetical protein
MVRAQWAQRPMLWQIYPQEADAHRIKLDAFLDRYCRALPPGAGHACRKAWHAWNGEGDMRAAWPAMRAALPALRAQMPGWVAGLRGLGDLAGNLLAFIRDRVPR